MKWHPPSGSFSRKARSDPSGGPFSFAVFCVMMGSLKSAFGGPVANAYLTITQLYSFYDERTVNELSNDNSSGLVDDAKLQDNLDAAAGELDSVLSGRVALPLAAGTADTALGFLRKMVADLAMRNLYGRRSDAPEEIQGAWQRAEQWLKDFMERRVSIPGISRASATLSASASFTGQSRFDRLPFGIGGRPSRTSTSHGT